jgi:hypothetical protein
MNRLVGADCAAEFALADTSCVDDGQSDDRRARIKGAVREWECL